MAEPRNTLDAEQIVRLTAAVLCELIDARRSQGAPAVSRDAVILRLAEMTGVKLPISEEYGIRSVLPYGTAMPQSPASTLHEQHGGSREA